MGRATSTIVGVTLLVSLTVLAATAVGTVAVTQAIPEPPPSASFTLTVDANSDIVAVTHRGGASLDVETVRLVVTIDSQRLAHQPPIPFFSATGFRSGPTGPFNPASSSLWESGETAQFQLASTNEPQLESGDEVTVRIVSRDSTVATIRSTAT